MSQEPETKRLRTDGDDVTEEQDWKKDLLEGLERKYRPSHSRNQHDVGVRRTMLLRLNLQTNINRFFTDETYDEEVVARILELVARSENGKPDLLVQLQDDEDEDEELFFHSRHPNQIVSVVKPEDDNRRLSKNLEAILNDSVPTSTTSTSREMTMTKQINLTLEIDFSRTKLPDVISSTYLKHFKLINKTRDHGKYWPLENLPKVLGICRDLESVHLKNCVMLLDGWVNGEGDPFESKTETLVLEELKNLFLRDILIGPSFLHSDTKFNHLSSLSVIVGHEEVIWSPQGFWNAWFQRSRKTLRHLALSYNEQEGRETGDHRTAWFSGMCVALCSWGKKAPKIETMTLDGKVGHFLPNFELLANSSIAKSLKTLSILNNNFHPSFANTFVNFRNLEKIVLSSIPPGSTRGWSAIEERDIGIASHFLSNALYHIRSPSLSISEMKIDFRGLEAIQYEYIQSLSLRCKLYSDDVKFCVAEEFEYDNHEGWPLKQLELSYQLWETTTIPEILNYFPELRSLKVYHFGPNKTQKLRPEDIEEVLKTDRLFRFEGLSRRDSTTKYAINYHCVQNWFKYLFLEQPKAPIGYMGNVLERCSEQVGAEGLYKFLHNDNVLAELGWA